MKAIETVSTIPNRGVDGYIFDPANPLGYTGSAGPAEFVMEPMPEGLAKIINYLDGGSIAAVPSISAASIAAPAPHERDFVDEHHRMLLFAGVATLLLLIFRVHN